MSHWLTCFDPEDGEPYGVGCDCEIGDDHFDSGELTEVLPNPSGGCA